MRKRYLFPIISVVGSSLMGYYVNKQRKKKKDNTTFENAGVPDQSEKKDLAQLENAKMVSEGSQFGVQYYNEVKSN